MLQQQLRRVLEHRSEGRHPLTWGCAKSCILTHCKQRESNLRYNSFLATRDLTPKGYPLTLRRKGFSMTSVKNLLRRLFCVVLLLVSVTALGFGSTFETARFVPVGNAPTDVAVGDFNHDGKLDMVVTNQADSSVSVLLGNGNGTFKPQSLLALDGRAVAVVVGDFNGDGILDIAALTTDIFVLLGNGDGTFRVGGMFGVGQFPSSITSADFNHDGKLDLAVVAGGGVDVLLGNGDGTFKAAVSHPAGDGPMQVATGD